MSGDLTSLPSGPPHSLSPNITRSSGFLSLTTRDPKSMSTGELEEEYQRLREENHQLQLRILGVNELARLLQDKNEQLQLVQDKNKRLELAVVRLENRCANIEKMSKTQKGGATSAPAGRSNTSQSPFIPGPSRQILESLMKENSELKKTLNSVTKKGASGYLEAVKITQLEEVIDCQKEELQFMREQIRQLTDGEVDSKDASGGGMSLPGHVSESGPLKRQLIKLQHATKVKDRFCALLSQQIAELQGKLNVVQQQLDEGAEQSKSVSNGGNPVEETAPLEGSTQPPQSDSSTSDLEARYKTLYEDQKAETEELRKTNTSTLEKLERVEKELKNKAREAEEADRLRDQVDLYISEKAELAQTLELAQKDLEELMRKGSGDGGSDGGVSRESFMRVERERDDLRKVLEDQTKQHTEQRQSYETDLLVLRTQVENEEYKRAVISSEMEQKIKELGQQKAELEREIDKQNDTITELRDDIEGLQSETSALREQAQNSRLKHTTALYGGGVNPGGAPALNFRSGGSQVDTNSLIYPAGSQAGRMGALKDGGTPSVENRALSTGHCEKSMSFTDNRTQLLARNGPPTNPERPTHLPQTFQYNMGRPSPPMPPGAPTYYAHHPANTPVSQPQPRMTGGPMLNPSYRGYQRTPSGNTPMQPVQQPTSPFRPHTQPVPMATSPTSFGNVRPGYPNVVQADHPLTTTSSMYSQGGNVFSQPGARQMGQPPASMRPSHAYQRSEDDTPGGQRSPSPNPHGQHR